MIQKFVRERLPPIIIDNLSSVGIVIAPNPGSSDNERRNALKRFNDALMGVLSIREFNITSENWAQEIQVHLGELSKVIFPFVRQIVETKEEPTRSDEKISLNFISNI